MSPEPKEVLHLAMYRQKSLRLQGSLESSHNPFSLPDGLVWNLYPIIGIAIGNANDIRHDPPTRSGIASQLVCHQPPGTTTLPFQELTEESYRGISTPPLLDEYVDDVAVLVDRTIEIMLLPPNTNEQLVHMPGITVLTMPSTQASRISRAKFRTPSANRFV